MTRNAVLAARLAELGLTEQELAERINEEIRRVTGSPGRTTDRYVRLLLDGTIRWPWPVRRQALETVLGLPILQLGFVPRAASGHRGERPSTPAQVAESRPVDASVVLVAGGWPLSLELPPPPGTRLGASDLDRLARPLALLYDLHTEYGPVGLAPAAARHATRLAAAQACVMSSQVQAGLYGLCGEWWTTAAWLALQAGDLAQADRFMHAGLWQAVLAQDPLLDAHLAHVIAARASRLGKPVEAIAAARTIIRRAPRTRDGCRVAAVGHLHAAAAHAAQGSLPRAELSLDKASDALRIAGARPAPWLARIGTWAVYAYRARAALAVGRYDLAAQQAQHAIDTTPHNQVWDRLMALLPLVEACLGLREVEQAVEHASAALDLAPRLTDPAGCATITAELEHIAKRFAAWPEVSPTQQWCARYQAATAAGDPARRRPAEASR